MSKKSHSFKKISIITSTITDSNGEEDPNYLVVRISKGDQPGAYFIVVPKDNLIVIE